jgi:hypothetical protein
MKFGAETNLMHLLFAESNFVDTRRFEKNLTVAYIQYYLQLWRSHNRANWTRNIYDTNPYQPCDLNMPKKTTTTTTVFKYELLTSTTSRC